jgi:hypothetical protein
MIKAGLILAFLAASALTSAPHAQSSAVSACVEDVKAQCSGVPPGEGRIKTCVKSHLSDLSRTCRTLLLRSGPVIRVCAADFKRDCSGVKPGGGRMEKCMRAHLPDVGAPCKEALARIAVYGR